MIEEIKKLNLKSPRKILKRRMKAIFKTHSVTAAVFYIVPEGE